MASTTKMMKKEHSINIRNTSDDSTPYICGNREDYLNFIVPLYEASITGDWETAKLIFVKRRDMVGFALNNSLDTALHVVATSKETEDTIHFVNNLVEMMGIDELQRRNKKRNTAFWIACGVGNMEAAKIMLEKNASLLSIRGVDELTPLSTSALNGQYNIVKHLYNESKQMISDVEIWTDDDKSCTLLQCVKRDMFDIALQIVEDHQTLAKSVYLLEVLARKPDALNKAEKSPMKRIIEPVCGFFGMRVKGQAEEEEEEEEDTDALKLLKKIWKHATKTMNFKEIESMLKSRDHTHLPSLPDGMINRSSNILFVAAESGNTRFIVELLRTYPDLMLNKDKEGLTIFHIAVLRRHESIYNLLYEIGKSTYNICISIEEDTKNNMLHLVGKSSKEMAAKTPRASLLMQRELLWFKEVEEMMPSYVTEMKNKEGLTAYELFSKENEDLVTKGLKWMKDCMVVATLIVTIAFAVAFTIPGGYNQQYGFPIFIHNPTFLVFVIADAVSLFSSSTSLLVFLSILTSHHKQRDFMYSLPRKLMIGLLTLFFSVVAMMVTFSASFFVLYRKGLKWVPILIAALATVPVVMFALSQFPLLVDMIFSMYDSHYIFRPKKHTLYITKQMRPSNKSTSWRFRIIASLKGLFFKR